MGGDGVSPAARTVTGDDFLADTDANEIRWTPPQGAPAALRTDRVHYADGNDAFEVAVAYADGRPRVDDVRRLWAARWGRRAAPVVLVVAYQDGRAWRAAICGTRDDPAVLSDLDLSQVERICDAALSASDPVNAERTLHRLLIGQKDQLVAGLTNSGLFASHELRVGVPARPDWDRARGNAGRLLRLRGIELIRGLGYRMTPHGSTALILAANGTNRAVAVLLDEREVFDRPNARFGAVSPVAQGQNIAQEQGLDWLVITRNTQIRLYSARPDVGVGRKGQAETFVEVDLALLADDQAAYLDLLFSAGALAAGGTVTEILTASADHAAALGRRLRERVYEDAVPRLALAVAEQTSGSTDSDLQEAYHRTLIILFRLLFIAYAEDRGLLPYQRNPRYTKRALKTMARELAEKPDVQFDEFATDRWDDLLAIWRAVDDGNSEWGVPAYNGGLFAADAEHPSGHAIARMRLTNAEIGPALRALLVDTGEDGTFGPVDFRSLSVREFGTVYEGLLESSLSVAPVDLTVSARTKAYLPAGSGDEVVVPAGQVYFHNASGARKSSGSYFTKAFAVARLLDTALEPAISAHLDKVAALLAEGDDARAADTFFDFRVADLAMGSGHFLVAAIDRIESRFSAFLAAHPIPTVNEELRRLGDAAREALGGSAPDIEIEPSALLRRQVARRCIYGLDLNLIAVELARLAIWIHTFVPGLPMSTLDHNLVVGNSLTGIGTVDELVDVLEPQREPGQVSFFADGIQAALRSARDRLQRVARTAEATRQEVREAAQAHTRALQDAVDAKAFFDTAVAVRLGLVALPNGPDAALEAGRTPTVRAKVADLDATHLAYQFPEVFLRDNPGFDVVLGNPPWEKVRWEAAPYWVGVFPGLMALPDRTREARIEQLRQSHPVEAAHEREQQTVRAEQQNLFKRSFTLRGGTHLEFAQLMLERALRLLRDQGHLGLVLPRSSMVLAGWKNLRERLVTRHDLRIVQGRNHHEWIFADVDERIAVVLMAAGPRREGVTRVWVATDTGHVAAAGDDSAITMSVGDLATYSETYVVPWFAGPADRDVFDRMRTGPRLAGGTGWVTAVHDARWDFRGSGPDRALAVRDDSPGAWRVLMTAHVDAFGFDTGEPYKQFVQDLDALAGRKRGVGRREGRFVLTDRHPLIIVRHPSRSDDSRTVIAAALPETGVLHNKGYVHAVMHAPNTPEAARLALLGLLNTVTVDWWVRRFVDRHITAPVINQIPLPHWADGQITQAADITAILLQRRGYRMLAGGIDLAERTAAVDGDLRAAVDAALLARLERLALHGYGLDGAAFVQMCTDFNTRGTPEDLRTAVLSELAR
ncbi:MAG TPA: hypothetical protein VF657_10160 [Actinoplanes sp.]